MSLITTRKLVKVIDIHPRFLDHNLEKTIQKTLLSEFSKYCSEENGIIVDILSDQGFRILSNIINKESQAICFKVEFDAILLKPYKGLQILFTPIMILQKGLVGKLYKDSIIIFVPDDMMPGWQYQEGKFVRKGSASVLDRATEVTVEVVDFKFDTTKYNCIAKIMD
jgi:DNA-directed RNA polymerase subunit E'/Rpb7